MTRIIYPEEHDASALYRLLVSIVVPRPIAWISTLDGQGGRNLAPFSYFNAICAGPPHLMVCPNLRRGQEKDTLRNIRSTGEFVVNMVTRKLAEKMNQTSAEVAPTVDEFELAGLTAAPSQRVKPPRVAESPINLECRRVQLVDLNESAPGVCVVIGQVVCVHVQERLMSNGQSVDPVQYDPIGRLGGVDYCTIRDRFPLPRPREDRVESKS